MARTLRLLAVILGFAAPFPALADDIAAFYRGREITLYVGYAAGGGYDRYSRTLARHIGRHIPGNPRVAVKNRPGGASLSLANELYDTLPQDGTAIATIGRAMPTEPLFGNRETRFDPRRFTWLGSMNNEVSLCVAWHTVPVYFWDDLSIRGAVMGGTGDGSDTDSVPRILNNILGTKFSLITGYPSGNDIVAAMESGAVEGRCAWSWASISSTRPDWIKDKRIKLLLQMSTAKHPGLPDVPLVTEFATGRLELQALKLIFSRQLWGRPYLVGPGVPEARALALRAAFVATMKDAAFLKDAQRQRLEVNWVTGPVIQNTLSYLYDFPKDAVAAAVKAQTERSDFHTLKAVIAIETRPGRIAALSGGNRRFSWKGDGIEGDLRIRDGLTEISVDDRKAGRAALKAGMGCTFTYRASLATKIACK